MSSLEYTINGTVMVIALLVIGSIIFQKKPNYQSVKEIIKLLISTLTAITITVLVNTSSENLINNTVRIMVLFTMFIGYYKVIYKREISTTILASFITYLIYFLAEVIVDIPLYMILNIYKIPAVEVRNAIIVNILIAIMSVILSQLLKNKIQQMMRNGSKHDKILRAIAIIILLTLSILFFFTPISELRFNTNFIITMILLILFCFIGFILLKQRTDKQKITDKYTKLAQYSKNEEGLLEEYRMMVHDNKNHLIAIDNMIPEEYTEAHDYIANLLNKAQNNKYYWLTELKFVPSPELKGFMNYKILEMMNEKIDVEINISREIKKSSVKNYSSKDKENLYSIIGIYLDNAREAASESKEKSVSIQMYVEDNNIKLVIANTFKGEIDLEKIEEYGYSSKEGMNRGNGLHIVNEIISRNNLFEKETGILDNYFYQELTIHPKK